MKLLNKQTDYAVRALAHMAANPGRFVPSSEIAESGGIPLLYLRRLQQVLIRQKLLTAREGAGGGVKLARPAGDIRVADIIELFQGKVQLSECMFRKKICPNRATCILRRRILGIENTVLKEFRKISIADLLKTKE
jgi:Rrf2 family protein